MTEQPVPNVRSGLDPATFSDKVRPGDDFFRFVNGPWLEKHTIPADRAADGAFHRLRDEAEKNVRKIIEEAPRESRIGALYASFMDTEAADAAGTDPLAADLDLVEAAADGETLATAMGRLQRAGVHGALGYYVFADADDPDRNVVYLGQGGLGLPDESYYREDAHADTRAKYVAHLDRLADLAAAALGRGSFTGAQVMAVETAIAEHHWDIVKTREADLTYNPTTLTRLADEAPGFPWAAWADALGMPAAGHGLLVAGEPSFFTALGTLWPGGGEALTLEDWKAWMRWKVVNSRAAYLTVKISKANFDFYGTVLSGAPKQRARWKRAVGFVEGIVGEEVGREYVARHFPPAAKLEMDRLVANLVEAYRESISGLEWMTDETKQRALDKLRQFTPKIGYPEKWREYDGLEASPADLVGNVRAASAFEDDWEWAKLGKPVDRTEWLMTPQTVNAYYLPVANEIVFPAAILQPPFFDPAADDAVNYGAIGSVIGHEIGHGFDDQGSKFDGRGRLTDWWTEDDRTAFMERAKVLIEQYNGYEPEQLAGRDGGPFKVNGALTVGENIGDLAGVTLALRAYRISLGGDLAAGPEMDGYTAPQRYFLGYALTERTKRRDEAVITQINTDPHSPEEFRINGIVRNMDAWYEAFGVTGDDALWLEPTARVTIW